MARVLLIESDKILADNIKQSLKRAGHKVDWQTDLQVAMDSADAMHPDVILVDLLLAGRSAIEFLYELRSYPEWQKLPVIIYSSISPEEFGAINAGFHQLHIAAYHYKPTTSMVDICRSIDSVLQPAKI